MNLTMEKVKPLSKQLCYESFPSVKDESNLNRLLPVFRDTVYNQPGDCNADPRQYYFGTLIRHNGIQEFLPECRMLFRFQLRPVARNLDGKTGGSEELNLWRFLRTDQLPGKVPGLRRYLSQRQPLVRLLEKKGELI